jgi:predicted MFS family arabinose efflux permease
VVPNRPPPDDPAAVRRPFDVLRKPPAVLALTMTVLVFTGIYVVITYAAVIVEDLAGLPRETIALALLLSGAGSILGNAAGGFGADRLGVRWTVIVSGLVMAAGLVVLSLQPTLVVISLSIMTLGAGAFVPTQQARLVSLASGAPDFGLALNLAALNVGIATGAAVGSVLLTLGLLPWLGVIGSAIVLLATLLAASTTSEHG